MKKEPYDAGDAYKCGDIIAKEEYDMPQTPVTLASYLDAKSEEDKREIPMRNLRAGIELAKVHAFGGGEPGDKECRDELDLALAVLGNDTEFTHRFMRNFSQLEGQLELVHDLARGKYEEITSGDMSLKRLSLERDLLNLMGLLKIMGMQIRDHEERDPLTGAQMSDVLTPGFDTKAEMDNWSMSPREEGEPNG